MKRGSLAPCARRHGSCCHTPPKIKPVSALQGGVSKARPGLALHGRFNGGVGSMLLHALQGGVGSALPPLFAKNKSRGCFEIGFRRPSCLSVWETI